VNWLRLAGEEATAVAADDAILDRRIFDFIEHSPYSYGGAISKAPNSAKRVVPVKSGTVAFGCVALSRCGHRELRLRSE
jgi:hypothetical protein